MRKMYVMVFLMGCINSNYAQLTGQLFTGTFKPGSNPNAAKVVIKSSADFTGKFTNVQFTFQIPDSVTPQPQLTIKSNPLSTYIQTAGYTMQTSNEGGFYNYLFAATTAASPTYSFTSGTEIDALEVEINCCPGKTAEVRLAQVANGGLSAQMNFYVEVSGNDNTNTTTPFYGTGAVNTTGGYTSYSYVPLAGIVLPLSLTGFTAIKKDMSALLTWVAENQDVNSSHFEIERSFNGINFTYAGRVAVNLYSGASAMYNFTDTNIALTRPKGLIFYRIKSVDKDRKIGYSEIRNIKINSKGLEVNLYPNPAKTHTIATLALGQASAITISILDAAGKEIEIIKMPGIKGINLKRIDLSGLAKGSYLLKVHSGDQVQTIPLVKAQ